MFFLFLISLHVHIKRPYSFPLIINISLFRCAWEIYLGLGPWFYRYIFKANSLGGGGGESAISTALSPTFSCNGENQYF